jgi:hypothetical protein
MGKAVQEERKGRERHSILVLHLALIVFGLKACISEILAYMYPYSVYIPKSQCAFVFMKLGLGFWFISLVFCLSQRRLR